MKKPRLDFHELCRTTSLLVPTVKDLININGNGEAFTVATDNNNLL